MKTTLVILIATIAVCLASCRKKGCIDPHAENFNNNAEVDDGSCTYCICPPNMVPLSGTYNSDLTLSSNVIYECTGPVVITGGATLTIAPGAIIKFSQGNGSLASMLIIAKDGQINATGTATQPIIFTSVLDNIEPGQVTGSNLSHEDKGLWGGIVILGEAPISALQGDDITNLTFVPPSEQYSSYGGSNPQSTSGTLNYVSIRHSGALVGNNEELNGLTLGGVGAQTTLNNIEIVAAQDDGIAILGGNASVQNLVIGYPSDDALSIDQGFDGSITNFSIIHDAKVHRPIDVKGPEGISNTSASFQLSNGSVINTTNIIKNSIFMSNARGMTSDIKFNGAIEIGATHDPSCATLEEDCLYYLIENNPRLVFQNCERTAVAFRSICPISITDSTNATIAIPNNSTMGNLNQDLSWTWLSLHGHL